MLDNDDGVARVGQAVQPARLAGPGEIAVVGALGVDEDWVSYLAFSPKGP